MQNGGNQKGRALWYGNRTDIIKPNPSLCGSDKEFKLKLKEHIKKVYIDRAYKSTGVSTPVSNTQPSSTNKQQPSGSAGGFELDMPYNNVQYNNGGIDTRNRGASLKDTQYANLKTNNSNTIIQSGNISGVNAPQTKNDLLTFNEPLQINISKETTSYIPTTGPNQPYGRPPSNGPPMNNMNQPMPYGGNNYNAPPMNNMNQPYGSGGSYNQPPYYAQPPNNMYGGNMNQPYGGGGYNNYNAPPMMNNQPPMNNNMNQPYGGGNNMNQPPMNNMNPPYGSGGSYNAPYGNYGNNNMYQPPVNNAPMTSSGGYNNSFVNSNQPRNTTSPSFHSTPPNPMNYNNPYGTPMTPTTVTTGVKPVDPYARPNVGPTSTVGSQIPVPPSTTVPVNPTRSVSMPPKSTPPPVSQPSSLPPTKVTPKTSLNNQFNSLSVSGNTLTASTQPKLNPTQKTTTTAPSTTTTANHPKAGSGLVGTSSTISTSEWENTKTGPGTYMDDLRGNASNDNIKFKEINPNKVIPMKQTTDWQ